MKRLILSFILVPMVAIANPILSDCELQYKTAHAIMMARQGGLPMPETIRLFKMGIASESPDDLTVLQRTYLREAEHEAMMMIDHAYESLNVSVLPAVAERAAVEFGNEYYLKCRRLAKE